MKECHRLSHEFALCFALFNIESGTEKKLSRRARKTFESDDAALVWSAWRLVANTPTTKQNFLFDALADPLSSRNYCHCFAAVGEQSAVNQ